MAADTERATVALTGIPLFAGQGEATLRALRDQLRPCQFTVGQTILWQDEQGAHLYLICQGTVRVSVVADNGEKIHLRDMGPGEYFGELSLLDGKPRSADVVALTDCQLLALAAEDFWDFAGRHPQVSREVVKQLAGRVRDLTERMQKAGLLHLGEGAG